MKKVIFSLALFLTCSLLAVAQKGISYQAVILDPNPIEIPGQDITGQPFVNGAVSLKFKIFSSTFVQEFEEVHATQTDAYGMVNVLIGSVSQGAFSSLVWDSKQKSLQVWVSFDQGGTYTKVSEQQLTYNPYAIYAETASKLSETLSIAGGGTGATTAAAARTNLGLGNVDNTADVNKPISTATQSALATKANADEVNTALATKANAAEVNTALATKANAAEVNTALATKANASDVTTSLGLKEDVSNKANTPLGTSTSLYPTQNAVKTYVDAQIASATIPDADASKKGKIQLAGDLAGTAAAPTVPGLALKANASDVTTALAVKADTAYVLTKVAAATIADASSSTKGKIQLAGDLAGTAAAPTVPGLALKAPLASPIFTGTVTTAAINTGALSSTAVTAPTYASAPRTLTYTGSTINWNPALGLNAAITLTQNSTLSFTAAPPVGSYGTVVLTQDGTGGRTLTLPTLAGATNQVLGSTSTSTVALSTAASSKDILNFYYDGTIVYWNIGQGYGAASTTNSGPTNLASSVTGTLAVGNGGTGATNAADARINLGLVIGTNVQAPLVAGTDYLAPNGNAANLTNFPTLNQNTTGNAANVTGIVAVANGGTGAVTLTGYVKGTGNTAMTASATIPVADVTGAAPLASPTFTGTLTAPIYATTPQLLTSGSTITWNPTQGLNASVTLDQNSILSFSATPPSGSYGTLVVTQDGTGGRTITLPATANKVLGSTSTTSIALSTSAGAKDILNFYYDGTNCYWNIGQGYGAAATAATTNLASSVTGTLPVANGGTGAATLTGLVKGNGTGAMTAAAAGTDYLAPTGSAAGLTNFPTLNQNTTGNAATATLATSATSATNATTAGNITATSNTTLTSLANLTTVGTITSGTWSGTAIAVANGGTGATTLTANNVLLGNGTSALKAVAPGASGNVLTSDGTTWTSSAPSGGGGSGSHYVGEVYGGGVVFYTWDNGAHGLIVAKTDQCCVGSTSGKFYAGTNTRTMALNGRGGASTSAETNYTTIVGGGVGAGKKNTLLILSSQGYGDGSMYAARYANEYSVTAGGVLYDDWYLGSVDEYHLLANNYNSIKTASGFTEVQADKDYWTSTEIDQNMAYTVYLKCVASSNIFRVFPNNKSFTASGGYGNVRAIRSF